MHQTWLKLHQMMLWANPVHRAAPALPQKENYCKKRQRSTGTIAKLAFAPVSSRILFFLSQCSKGSNGREEGSVEGGGSSLKSIPWGIRPYWSGRTEKGWSDVIQKASLNPKLSLFLMLSYPIFSSLNSNRESLGIIFAF